MFTEKTSRLLAPIRASYEEEKQVAYMDSHRASAATPEDMQQAAEKPWSRRNWPNTKLRSMWPHLTLQQVELLREVFDNIDKEGKGYFTKDELFFIMESMGGSPTPQELDAVMFELDSNNDHVVDFPEFLAKFYMATDTTELVKVFNNLVNQDQSAGENTLTLAALEKSFAYVGDVLSDVDKLYLKQIFERADDDGNGTLDIAEFSAYMEKMDDELLNGLVGQEARTRSKSSAEVNTVAEAELDGTKGLLGKLAKSVTARSKKSATSRAGGKMDDGMNGSSPGASVYSKQASSPLAPGVGTSEAEVRMQSFEAGVDSSTQQAAPATPQPPAQSQAKARRGSILSMFTGALFPSRVTSNSLSGGSVSTPASTGTLQGSARIAEAAAVDQTAADAASQVGCSHPQPNGMFQTSPFFAYAGHGGHVESRTQSGSPSDAPSQEASWTHSAMQQHSSPREASSLDSGPSQSTSGTQPPAPMLPLPSSQLAGESVHASSRPAAATAHVSQAAAQSGTGFPVAMSSPPPTTLPRSSSKGGAGPSPLGLGAHVGPYAPAIISMGGLNRLPSGTPLSRTGSGNHTATWQGHTPVAIPAHEGGSSGSQQGAQQRDPSPSRPAFALPVRRSTHASATFPEIWLSPPDAGAQASTSTAAATASQAHEASRLSPDLHGVMSGRGGGSSGCAAAGAAGAASGSGSAVSRVASSGRGREAAAVLGIIPEQSSEHDAGQLPSPSQQQPVVTTPQSPRLGTLPPTPAGPALH